MKNIWLVVVAVVIGAGYYGFNSYIKEVRQNAFDEGVRSVKPAVKVDTVKIPYEKTVYIRKTELDTMYIVKTDTVTIMNNSEQYTATGIYEDSTIYIKARYFSPVPLSDKGFFRIGFHYECPEITKTVYIPEPKIEPGFFDSFGYGLTFGVGYGLTTKKADVFLGLGIHYNFSYTKF